MNTKNDALNPPPICDVIASQVDPFLTELKMAGYPANTLSTKRAALRKLTSWRRRRKNAGDESDESEVKAFMAKACRNEKGLAHLSLRVYLPVAAICGPNLAQCFSLLKENEQKYCQLGEMLGRAAGLAAASCPEHADAR